MTAYEMRISDWSSDVCSSDLLARLDSVAGRRPLAVDSKLAGACPARHGVERRLRQMALEPAVQPDAVVFAADGEAAHVAHAAARTSRSEEHTSELQSLMRISYAVLCLEKKNDIETV